MNPFGRIPVCGLISMYNTGPKGEGEDKLPKLMRRVLTDRLKIQGFIVSDRAADRQKARSEEHTSELPSLMRISYAVLCLKKTKQTTQHNIREIAPKTND